jgi:hypothetical protein
MPPRSQRQRDAEKRREKLRLIEEQIRDGSLKVRKMTAAERARWGRPDPARRPARRRRSR